MMIDIPEGATHTLDGFYFKIKGQVWFYYSSKPQCFNWKLSMLQNIYIENNATPIKQDKEMIYTKQMHEAGECPRLGMSFTFKGGSNDYIAKVIGLAIGSDHIQVVTFEYTDKTGLSGIECAFFDKSVFHSIDTRTEAEKNEEEVIKYMNDFVSTITSNRHPIDQIDVDEQNIAIFNQIKTGKIPHITFTGDK